MSITTIFILITILAAILFDVYIIFKAGKKESISAYVIRSSKQYPLVTLLVGIVLGHLYWPMRTDDIYYDVTCTEVKK